MIFREVDRLKNRVASLPSLSLLVLFLFQAGSTSSLFAQETKQRSNITVAAGMGVSYINPFDLVDYMNQFTSQKVPDFSSAVEFFIAPETCLSEDFNVKLEYAYLLKTQNIVGSFGSYSFDYSFHMPTVLLVYVIDGEGFYVKIGGGLGYHFGAMTSLTPSSADENRYTSTGLGLKLELMGNTAFGESLYGLIGADLRLDFVGRLKDAAGRNPMIGDRPVKLNFASAGIKFGLAYYF
jgi:hypothetical protein